jgi:hypothetical protein
MRPRVTVAEWLDAQHRESERHRIAISGELDPRERLIAKLDEMAARMRAAPDWREPTPEEQEQAATEIEAWFRQHGYLREG